MRTLVFKDRAPTPGQLVHPALKILMGEFLNLNVGLNFPRSTLRRCTRILSYLREYTLRPYLMRTVIRKKHHTFLQEQPGPSPIQLEKRLHKARGNGVKMDCQPGN